jgi:predicted lipid-binding transport protein (Tim44 family)
MLNKWIMVVAAALSLGLLVTDANAKRLGGGSSIGAQRSITPPAAKPPVSQQAPAATPPAAPAPQPSGMSRFLGPLAGLALGAGLASMFMGGGLGGGFGGILMILALAAAAVFAFRMLRSKPAASPLQYAGAGTAAAPGAQNTLSSGFGGAAPAAPVADRFPPGFDAAQFAHHAKLNFTKLQTANDNADLSAMRDLMTPGLYAEVEASIKARGQTPQKTDVVTLEADVIEVVTEGKVYVASINFSGMIREDGDAAAAAFSEIWHLEKPVDGSTGWLISGIQQN